MLTTVLRTVTVDVAIAVASVGLIAVAVAKRGVEVLRLGQQSHLEEGAGNSDVKTVEPTVEVCVAVTRGWVKVKSGPKNNTRLSSCFFGAGFTTRLRRSLSLVHPEILLLPLTSGFRRIGPAESFV